MAKRKGRSLGVISIIALFVAISGLTIAYAAISDSMGSNEDAIWKIEFRDLEAEKSGKAVYSLPVLSDTSLQNYSVELMSPGDSVHLSFKIENRGNMDAILSTLWQSPLNCRVVDGTQQSICKEIEYTLKYEDGSAVAMNDLLNHASSKVVQLSIVYPTSATALTSGKIVMNDINVFMIYKQNG